MKFSLFHGVNKKKMHILLYMLSKINRIMHSHVESQVQYYTDPIPHILPTGICIPTPCMRL